MTSLLVSGASPECIQAVWFLFQDVGAAVCVC